MQCMENINGKTRLYVLLLHCKGNKTKKKELERKIKQENLKHQQYSEQNQNQNNNQNNKQPQNLSGSIIGKYSIANAVPQNVVCNYR